MQGLCPELDSHERLRDGVESTRENDLATTILICLCHCQSFCSFWKSPGRIGFSGSMVSLTVLLEFASCSHSGEDALAI